MENKQTSISVKINDEFTRLFGPTTEVYRLIGINKGNEMDKKMVTYSFETYIDGIKTNRPEFSMGKKYFDDLIKNGIWKQKS